MDIKQLKFLIALDETRHFGQAAARCHITQPTLSMRLRSLEEELELQLVNRGQRLEFHRTWRTRAGVGAHGTGGLRRLAGRSRSLSGQSGRDPAPRRRSTVELDPLPLLHRLHKEHPNLRFELSALSSEQVLEQLASNRIDPGHFLSGTPRHRTFRRPATR